jgi:histidine phosphotransferase ChpT
MSLTKEKMMLSLSELVATRLCHDLAGPVGALNNGVEFLADGGEDMAAQAVDLLTMSAQEARAKLQLFRMAYGVIHEGAKASPEELREIILSYFGHSKIKPLWELRQEQDYFTAAMRRVLANMVLVSSSALLAGGTLEIKVDKQAHGVQMEVWARGPKIKQDAEMEQATKGMLEAEPTSKLVPALLIAHHSQQLGGKTHWHAKDDSLHLVMMLPA